MMNLNKQKKLVQFLCASTLLVSMMPTYGLAAQAQQIEMESRNDDPHNDDKMRDEVKAWKAAVEAVKEEQDDETVESVIDAEADADEKEQAVVTTQELAEPKKISELFPDPVLADLIAKRLDKAGADETVEQRELDAMDVLEIDERTIDEHTQYIKDLTGLSYLSNLKVLGLAYNKISDLSPISTLTQLTHLHLNSNNITNVTPLSKLTNIQYLELNSNQIKDLTPIRDLTKMDVLSLVGNGFEDISALSAFSNVRRMNLTGNLISDITALSSLKLLSALSLRDNSISDISPLQSIENLRDLDLKSNKIASMSPIGQLKRLQSLGLGGNNIDNLSFLKTWNLPDLMAIDLRGNHIVDLTSLNEFTRNFPKLRQVDVRYQETNVHAVSNAAEIVVENIVKNADGTLIQPSSFWPKEDVRYEAPYVHWKRPKDAKVALAFSWKEEGRLNNNVDVLFSGYSWVEIRDEEVIEATSSSRQSGGKLVSTGGYTVELILVGGVLMVASTAAMYALRKRKALH